MVQLVLSLGLCARFLTGLVTRRRHACAQTCANRNACTGCPKRLGGTMHVLITLYTLYTFADLPFLPLPLEGCRGGLKGDEAEFWRMIQAPTMGH